MVMCFTCEYGHAIYFQKKLARQVGRGEDGKLQLINVARFGAARQSGESQGHDSEKIQSYLEGGAHIAVDGVHQVYFGDNFEHVHAIATKDLKGNVWWELDREYGCRYTCKI
jgi:hypothetical protein